MKQQVSLRPYTRADREPLRALFSDAHVMKYVGDGKPMERDAAAAGLDKILSIYETDPAFFIWTVREGDDYAGHAELKCRKGRSEYELIYVLEKERWGHGLGGSVVDLLLSEARKRGIPFVIATVDPKNTASIAILRRRGFADDAELSAQLDCAAYRLDLA